MPSIDLLLLLSSVVLVALSLWNLYDRRRVDRTLRDHLLRATIERDALRRALEDDGWHVTLWWEDDTTAHVHLARTGDPRVH